MWLIVWLPVCKKTAENIATAACLTQIDMISDKKMHCRPFTISMVAWTEVRFLAVWDWRCFFELFLSHPAREDRTTVLKFPSLCHKEHQGKKGEKSSPTLPLHVQ